MPEITELETPSSLGAGDPGEIAIGEPDTDPEDTQPLTVPPKKEAGLLERTVAAFRKPEDVSTLIGKAESGFKAFDGADGKARFIGWYSNAFVDRDQEAFPAKAIDAFIARVDMGMVPYPEFWLDHVPGAKAGKVDWLGRIGLISVAVGTFDDTDIGRAAQKYFATSRKSHTMSHGFEYDPTQKRDRMFWSFNTYEVSALPVGREANPFTSFGGVKEMPIAEWKLEDLNEKLGEDLAKRVLETTEEYSKALVEKNVAWKEFSDPNQPASTVISEQSVKAASADLKELIPDLIEMSAETFKGQSDILSVLKAQKAEISDLLARVKTAESEAKLATANMAALKADLPRSASKDADTVVEDTHELVAGLVREQADETLVRLMPGLFNGNGKG